MPKDLSAPRDALKVKWQGICCEVILKRHLNAAEEYRQIFARGHYYIELMDHGIMEQKKVNEDLIKIAQKVKFAFGGQQ